MRWMSQSKVDCLPPNASIRRTAAAACTQAGLGSRKLVGIKPVRSQQAFKFTAVLKIALRLGTKMLVFVNFQKTQHFVSWCHTPVADEQHNMFLNQLATCYSIACVREKSFETTCYSGYFALCKIDWEIACRHFGKRLCNEALFWSTYIHTQNYGVFTARLLYYEYV